MDFSWTILFCSFMCSYSYSQEQSTKEGSETTPGYRFRYFVRDDRTGDIKGQTEVRQGDNVQGSYALAEPNGDMRVVTYTAGKDTGFRARVQVQPINPPLPTLPTNEPGLSHLMRIPPRNIYRTGFPQLEIKVVPPSTPEPQVTQKPPFTPEEEQLLRSQEAASTGYSEQNYERFSSPTDVNKGEAGVTTVHHAQQITTTKPHLELVNSSTATKNTYTEEGPCPATCDTSKEDEGRTRIKQEGDEVQLEMEQVIRTEMKDPEGVKIGKPYQKNQPTMRPDNIGTPPLYFNPFRPDIMTPVYMKPLYLRSHPSPNSPRWPPIVSSGDRLYIPHIVVESEDVQPDIFPSKVYLVPLPRPITLPQEELSSSAFTWDGKPAVPREEINKPNRAKPYPTYTYLLIPKELRGK